MIEQHYTRRKWSEGDKKEHKVETRLKNFKNHIIDTIITSKDFLSVKIYLKKNK